MRQAQPAAPKMHWMILNKELVHSCKKIKLHNTVLEQNGNACSSSSLDEYEFPLD